MLITEEFQLILLLKWSKSHRVNAIAKFNWVQKCVYTRKDGTRHVGEIDVFLQSLVVEFSFSVCTFRHLPCFSVHSIVSHIRSLLGSHAKIRGPVIISICAINSELVELCVLFFNTASVLENKYNEELCYCTSLTQLPGVTCCAV